MFALEQEAEWAYQSLADLGYEVCGISTDTLPGESCEYRVLIEIEAACKHLVTLAAPRSLAAMVASRYLETPASELDEQAIEDAFKELTNTLAGHFKATLLEGTQLGLPQSMTSTDWAQSTSDLEVSQSLEIMCDGQPLFLCVHRQRD